VGGESKVIGYDMIYALVKYEFEYFCTVACSMVEYGAKKRNQPPQLNASKLSYLHDVDLLPSLYL
jgi:hypothetical protein